MTTPAEQPRHDTVLQDIIDRLGAQHAGGDPEQVRGLLEREMTEAGLGTGAEKWIRDAADEIVSGRTLVVDATEDRRPPDPQ